MKKRLLTTLLVSAITLSSVALPLGVAADDLDDVISQQEKEVSNRQEKIKALQDKQASTKDQIAALNSQISDTQAEAEDLMEKQAKLQKDIEKLGQQIETLQGRIEKRNTAIQNQARKVQVNNKETSIFTAVLEADSFSDAISRLQGVTTMVKANNDMMNQQKQDKQDVETKQNTTKTKSAEIGKAQVSLEKKLETLNQDQLELNVLKAQLEAEEATEQDKKEAAEQKVADAKAEKERQEEAARKAAEEAARQAAAEEAARQQAAQQAQQNARPQTPAPAPVVPSTPAPAPVTPTPTPTPVAPTPAPSAPSAGSSVIATAEKYLGTPYVWGGSYPNGFDCSSLVQHVFAQHGISLPRVTYQQEYAGTVIPVSQAQAGDLYFWGARGATYHVAIAAGGGRYIHAPQPGDVVKYGSVAWYAPSFAVRL